MRGYELLYPCTDKNLKLEYDTFLKKSQEIWDDFFVGKNKPSRFKLNDVLTRKFKKLYIETKQDMDKQRKHTANDIDRQKQLISVNSLHSSASSPFKFPESPLSPGKFRLKMVTDDLIRDTKLMPLKVKEIVDPP
jgi:hypothetical protein